MRQFTPPNWGSLGPPGPLEWAIVSPPLEWVCIRPLAPFGRVVIASQKRGLTNKIRFFLLFRY